MTTDLDELRAARPQVAPPSDRARHVGLETLTAAIEDEPAGLYARRRREPARCSRRRLPLGTLVSAAGVLVAAAIVIGAIALLGHHAPRHTAVAAGHPGRILSADGRPLRTRGPLESVLGASGLRTQYRSVLIQGEDLRTTLDGPLQRVADRALRNTLALNHGARQASLVAMDPRTGAIEAIGSAGAGSAHIDGAVQTASAPGATFDPITGLGALSSGRWTGSRRFGDTAGTFCTGRGVSRQCRSGQAFLPTAVSTALSVESDLFMYRLGAVMNVPAAGHPLGGPLQSSARSLGLGHRPEVDLPAAAAGLLPTPAWRARLNAAGRADGRPWSLGDELSLAVGQGNVAVTPLQLAVAYAGLETGITPLRPHLGDAAVGTGKTRLVHGSALLARVPVAASTFPPIRAGLRGVVSFPEGSPRMCCAR